MTSLCIHCCAAGHFWTPTYLAAQPAGTNAVFFRDSQLPPLTYYIGLHNNDKFHVLMASQGMNAGITSLVRTVGGTHVWAACTS